MTIPRQNSLVEFTPKYREWAKSRKIGEFQALQTIEFFMCETFFFLGEIPNIPERCIVVSAQTGKVFPGYNTDAFVEV